MPCCALVVAYKMLRACCWLSAARCSPHTECGGAVCLLLHFANARVLLHVVCCLLSVVCCMRCLLLAVFCAVFPACRRPPVVRCLVVCRPLHAVFATLSVVCCLHVARCMLRHMSWLFAACCTKSVPVFRCPPQCPMSHGVCCPSPVPSRISSRRMCCVASRLLYVACCTSRVACCLLCVACPILHVVTPSRLLPARTHARTPRSAAGLAGH